MGSRPPAASRGLLRYDRYRNGTWIEHPEHGVGQVLRAFPDRLEVRFGGLTRLVPRSDALTPHTPANSPVRAPGPTRRKLKRRRPATERPRAAAAPAAGQVTAKRPGGDAPAKAGGKPRTSREHWYPVPPDLLRDTRLEFTVVQLARGFAVRGGRSNPHNLLRLRVAIGGTWEATAAGNSAFGKTDAYKRAAAFVRKQIDTALARTSATGNASHVLTAMRAGRGQLDKAERQYKRPGPAARTAASRRLFVQGGAPGLGRRS
jgi:hypothetical protein